MRFIAFFLAVTLFIFSCKPETDDQDIKKPPIDKGTEQTSERKQLITARLQHSNTNYRLGDNIKVELQFDDSLNNGYYAVYHKDTRIDSLSISNNLYRWNSQNAHVGHNTLVFKMYDGEHRYESSVKVELLSDTKPHKYSYKVVNVFPHDRQAYTQGLFYKDGYLYEATGLRGESTIRRVKLETGEVIRSFAIPTEIFGEGITYYDGKLAQLSWEAGRGFVYDFETFKLINEFRYSGEGWGLDHYDGRLFMTDGSHIIRVLNDQTFSIIEEIEVYDDKGPVKYLNELEFINGKLWANIYRHEKIAIIDIETGKLEGEINLKRLLPIEDYTSQTDVLNGIAYDEENDRIFVTGKLWPKLFEITIH